MRGKALVLALALASGPALAADDALLAEIRRLVARVEALEKQNAVMETSLASERISAEEPEMVTRLKALEAQTLALQKPASRIEALDGISVGGSLLGVLQNVGSGGAAAGQREARGNYRGDVSVTLPGGEIGEAEGKIFAHVRFGQGNGLGLRPTYTSTANTSAFQVGSVAGDDSFAVLAQAWYQLKVPLTRGGSKADARESLAFTVGKIDPFVFFDQNAAADDESAKFLNNVFVHNPLLDSGGDVGADAYGFAPGAIVQYSNEHGAEWGLSAGVFGTAGKRDANGANFNGGLGQPLVIVQAHSAARVNFLPGNYRAYAWHNARGVGYDNAERRHAGFGVSADQKVSDELTLFARYGQQLQGKLRFDRALTLGAELSGDAWGRAADSVGLAFGALRTSGKFRKDSASVDADSDGSADFGYRAAGSETQLELYYRYRLNKNLELSPDFQLIRRPGGDGSASSIKVVGVRAKLGF